MSDTRTAQGVNLCPSCERTFGSDRGMKVHHKKAHGESLVKETAECNYCGTSFEYYPSTGHNGIACGNCRGKAVSDNTGSDETEECSYCGSEKSIAPWEYEWKDRFFCDMECKAKWQSENKKGENHPAWQGGWEHYYGDNWHSQREKAWKRDDYECRICGKGEEDLGRKPDVHHIVSVREYREEYGNRNLAHRLTNLITLCSHHHHRVEQGNVDIPVMELVKNV